MARRKVVISKRVKQIWAGSDESGVADRLRETRAAKRMVRFLAPDYGQQRQVVATAVSAGGVTNGHTSERKTYSDFTPEQWAEARRKRQEHFRVRQAELDAARALTPGMGCYGASNWPGLPDYADWRENLPEDDPLRQIGPPLIVSGSPEHHAQIVAASKAFTAAAQRDTAPNLDS